MRHDELLTISNGMSAHARVASNESKHDDFHSFVYLDLKSIRLDIFGRFSIYSDTIK